MARPPRTEFGAARRRAPMTSGISRGSYGTWTMPRSAPRVACDTVASCRVSRGSPEVDGPEAADLGHSALREAVGGHRRRHSLVVGEAQNALGRSEDPGRPEFRPFEVEA